MTGRSALSIAFLGIELFSLFFLILIFFVRLTGKLGVRVSGDERLRLERWRRRRGVLPDPEHAGRRGLRAGHRTAGHVAGVRRPHHPTGVVFVRGGGPAYFAGRHRRPPAGGRLAFADATLGRHAVDVRVHRDRPPGVVVGRVTPAICPSPDQELGIHQTLR